jgi:monothiol glutaredoxin
MPRPVLEEGRIHPGARERIAGWQATTIADVQQAVAAHPVVVVGMHQNPFVKKARRVLDAAGVAHHDILHGSYFSQWRRRSALKMWTGWPTLPMVFVKGTLVGGADDLQALIQSGELQRMLA